MKPLKQKISVSLDEDIILKVKELSEVDDRSVSQYINLLLKEHLESDSDNTHFNANDKQK